MSFFHLDVEKCKRDGICARVCVAGIIKNDDERKPYIDEKREKYCISCGLCVAFCPHDACFVENLDKNQFETVNNQIMPSPEQTDMLLKSRRSVRFYKKQTVDGQTLNKIFNSVRYAPSAKNNQSIRWIVSKSREETIRISDLIAEYFDGISKNSDTPESMKLKTLVKLYKQGNDHFLREAPQIAIAVMPKNHEWKIEDGSIALTYFEIAAHACGVGVCWGGYFTRAARNYIPLQEAIGVGENEFVCGAQFFGYPLYKITKIPSRKNTNITIL